MKTTVIAFASITLILTAFKTNTMVTEKKKGISTSEQMAERVVSALRQSSAKEFVTLFPSLSDFTEIMKESSGVYGSYLEEAQREFSGNYERNLIPAVKHSFETLIKEGEDRGIEWSSVRYVGIEIGAHPQQRFSPVPVNIVVSSKGREHRIHIEKALVINGQWKVSQFVSLL